MNKIAILGCAGFIGSHLTEQLLNSERNSVVGFDKVSDKIEHLLPHPRLSFHTLDIADFTLCKPYLESCDCIVSLTAICNPSHYNTIPIEVIESNFLEPLELVRFCATHNKWLIHFSTSEVYGKTVQGLCQKRNKRQLDSEEYLLSEDSSPFIMGPIAAQRWSYATAKQLMERVIYAYGEAKKLPFTIIRPFNVIGPRMDFIPGIDGEGIPRVLACFMDALLFGKPLQLVDGGTNKRSFTAIEDAVDALIRIIDNPDKSQNQIFNIGNPHNEVSIRELAKCMVDIYTKLYPLEHKHPRIISVTAERFYGKGYDDSDRRMPDITKARQLLGWEPRISLQEMLRKTIVYYKNYYKKASAA